VKAKKVTPKKKPTERSLLGLTHKQARAFLLKPGSYCRIQLPVYFDFKIILRSVEKLLGRKRLHELKLKPNECPDVNYTLYSNKDGRYAWRPLQLIHPIIYVDLVNLMTTPQAWAQLKEVFKTFNNDSRIRCLSIPQKSLTKRKDQAAQILHWWLGIEQASLELALDYNYVFHADIADCYASMYTHSIPWAAHGRDFAKSNKKDTSLLGNAIDQRIRAMRYGQTNGIPQGSVLMDFIAELVLGYADLRLSQRIRDEENGQTGGEESPSKFQILRYRDDYRIFVNNPRYGESILKTLTEILIELGLKLNATKTTSAQEVIGNSLKMDKREWLRRKQVDGDLQKHLLLIHCHGSEFPNAGSLLVALDQFQRRLARRKSIKNAMQLISIAIDIGFNSPRCFPICAAIVSKLLSTLPNKKERLEVFHRIRAKVDQLPNSGHLAVWLQRISYNLDRQIPYGENLCKLVAGNTTELWDNSWVTDDELRAAVDATKIVRKTRLKTLKPVVARIEFELFDSY